MLIESSTSILPMLEPLGGTGGVTQFADPDEALAFRSWFELKIRVVWQASRIPLSRKVLIAMLAVDMGGRAAEERLELRQGANESLYWKQNQFPKVDEISPRLVLCVLSSVRGKSNMIKFFQIEGNSQNELAGKLLAAAGASFGTRAGHHGRQGRH